MKFPHDERLRDWLSQLCDTLQEHDPEAVVLISITMDTNTMRYTIDATWPGEDTPKARSTYLAAAANILAADARQDKPELGN